MLLTTLAASIYITLQYVHLNFAFIRDLPCNSKITTLIHFCPAYSHAILLHESCTIRVFVLVLVLVLVVCWLALSWCRVSVHNIRAQLQFITCSLPYTCNGTLLRKATFGLVSDRIRASGQHQRSTRAPVN